MKAPRRVTGPLLDVLEVFLDALASGDDELHGWAIMKAVKRPGPTVYGVLDRLEDMRWVTARWEDLPPDENRPRRRFYTLTPNGTVEAYSLLEARRPRGAARPRTRFAFVGRLRAPVPGGGFG